MVKHQEMQFYTVSALYKTYIDDEVHEEEIILCHYIDNDGLTYEVYGATEYGLVGDFVGALDREDLDNFIGKLLSAVDPIYGEQIKFS